ncbi:hypothetical protein RF11_08247 [Thelohanellus kitauei]|uniref:Serpin domain-containing protein n=1 Tax=Thelohanellus kitauei TaxID=669202 RepID=A0A0C2N211_THEKT|nr:hypothetical protein RF11_08247 [Thelohanellus kitauei]
MADTINDLTIKLANHLLVQNEGINVVSFSGYLVYLTLLLINFGLQGQAKYNVSAFVNCNYSYIDFSFTKNVFEYECIDYFTMEEFSKVSTIKSAIFHSRRLVETFKQFALEKYDTEFINIDRMYNLRQMNTIKEWSVLLKRVPFYEILSEQGHEDLMLLFVQEYFVRFKWLIPLNKRNTKGKTFTDINSQTYNVKTMRIVDILNCYIDKESKASIVYVNLETNGTYAAVVLPFPDNNVKNLLQNITVIFLLKYRVKKLKHGILCHLKLKLLYIYRYLELLA